MDAMWRPRVRRFLRRMGPALAGQLSRREIASAVVAEYLAEGSLERVEDHGEAERETEAWLRAEGAAHPDATVRAAAAALEVRDRNSTTTTAAAALAELEAAATSSRGGPISRTEVMRRAQRWVDAKVPYSQSGWEHEFVTSGHKYRTDCSGFVSMAWNLPQSYTTSTMQRGAPCTRMASDNDMQPGDVYNRPGGHIFIFEKWANDAKTHVIALEEKGRKWGTIKGRRKRPSRASGYYPCRYTRITGGSASTTSSSSTTTDSAAAAAPAASPSAASSVASTSSSTSSAAASTSSSSGLSLGSLGGGSGGVPNLGSLTQGVPQLGNIGSQLGSVTSQLGNIQGQVQGQVAGLQGQLQSQVAGLQGQLQSQVAGLQGKFGKYAAQFGQLQGQLSQLQQTYMTAKSCFRFFGQVCGGFKKGFCQNQRCSCVGGHVGVACEIPGYLANLDLVTGSAEPNQKCKGEHDKFESMCMV